MGRIREYLNAAVGQNMVHAHGTGRCQFVVFAHNDQAGAGDVGHIGQSVVVAEISGADELVGPPHVLVDLEIHAVHGTL